MSEPALLAVGVSVLTPEGRLIDVADLEPLLLSTPSLIRQVGLAGGPAIDIGRISKRDHCLTLAALDGAMVLLRCQTETTPDLNETQWLVHTRRRDLAHVFKSVVSHPNAPEADCANDPRKITAMFLLAGAFEMANLLKACGDRRRVVQGYTFEALPLKVLERDGELLFEILPSPNRLGRARDLIN